jgi:hypothetical protein
MPMPGQETSSMTLWSIAQQPYSKIRFCIVQEIELQPWLLPLPDPEARIGWVKS